MSSFLFCLWDGGGCVPPVLSVAAALGERGHDVRVLADPVLREQVEDAGAEHVSWTRAPHRVDLRKESEVIRDWEARTPIGGHARARDRLMFGPAGEFAEDVLEELRRRPADVVATEFVLAGPLVAAEAAGVRSASLLTFPYPLPVPGRPPFGPGLAAARGPFGRLRDRALWALWHRMWNLGLPALNDARARHGLEPLPNVPDALGRADRVLALTSRAYDVGDAALPPNVVHVGPRLDDPAWAEPFDLPPGEDPLVLVGLSTTHQGQLSALRNVAGALGRLPVRGLVTTGPCVEPADLSAPAKVQVVRSAPHGQVLAHTAAVVTHAGHGTVIKALAAGVPLVCLPMGRDQDEVARRVTDSGAGIKLRPGASEAKIARALGRVLEEPSFRQAAERLAAAIRADVAEDRAAAELERLARSGAALVA